MMRTKDGVAVKLSTRQVVVVLLVGVLAIAGTAGVTYAALSASGRFGSHGKIVVIGVQAFDDAALTHEADFIEWGELSAGCTSTFTIWVKNNGTVPIILSMGAGDWVPLVAQQYVGYSWDYVTGAVLQKDAVIQVTITLTVNQYIVGVEDFTNNIYIFATKN